jgi:hypothetical protein
VHGGGVCDGDWGFGLEGDVMEFKVGDYVRYNEETFKPWLVRNAVYRISKVLNGGGLEFEGLSQWFHGWRFIPWTPQTGDFVLWEFLRDRPMRFEVIYEDGSGSNYARPDRLTPVLNRAPYSEGEKKVFNPAGMPFTPTPSADGSPVFTPAPVAETSPIKIPLGSTPTDEKMRQEREAKREWERLRLEDYESDVEVQQAYESLLFEDKDKAFLPDYLALVKSNGA